MDDPSFGNNTEATTSSGTKRPMLEYMGNTSLNNNPDEHVARAANSAECSTNLSINALVLYNQEFATAQILGQIHGHGSSFSVLLNCSSPMSTGSDTTTFGELQSMDVDVEPQIKSHQHLITFEEVQSTPVNRKRKAKGKTPIADMMK